MIDCDSHASATVVMTAYRPSDGKTWHEKLNHLWGEDIERTLEILQDVYGRGIQEPILVANDGMVRDGHHRIAAALALNIDVPVNFRR